MLNSLLPGYDINFQNLVSVWLLLMIFVVTVTFIVSEITVNYSQVDKLWSLLPIAYSWISVAYFPSPRLYVMASLVTVWGIRLSYNFSRKGGYNIVPWRGEEDYRWKILRDNKILSGRFRFGIFNFFFISLYQNIVILLFSSPLLLASLYQEKPLTITDLIAALFMVAFILTESIADNQLFRFHQEKKNVVCGNMRYNKSVERGFMSEGLWKYSRHPNFSSEQAIWISFYFFGAAASGKWINITLAGPVLLILIFAGSSRLTESISSHRYTQYADYQKEVPRFIPGLKRRKQA